MTHQVSPESSSTRYYASLTGIRAVASLMVVFYHIAQLELGPLEKLSFWIRPLVEFMRQWSMGVTIFFVLSGFLITARYMERIEPSFAWARRYMQNRFARIYPIYFLLTIIGFAFMLWLPHHGWHNIWPGNYTTTDKVRVLILNLTLLRAYFQDILFLGLPTAWSLTVEETFYVTAPLVLLTMKRSFHLLLYPIALFLVGLLLVSICSHYPLPFGLMGSVKFMIDTSFFGLSSQFFFGMALALLVAKQRSRTTAPGIVYTLAGGGGLLLLMAVLAMAGHFFSPADSSSISFGLLFVSLVAAPLLICVLFWGLIQEHTWFRAMLETRLFDLLGKSSYALYLIHLGIFNDMFRRYISNNNVVCLVVYILASIALYKWIEHPMHTRLRSAAFKPGFVRLKTPVS